MKNKKIIVIVATLILVFIGYRSICKAYYKIAEPLYLEHHYYISTDMEKNDIKLFYFCNKDSNIKVVGAKQQDNDPQVKIKLLGDYGENYQTYYDRHILRLELTGAKPGETEINELTFMYNDGTEAKVKIGRLVYKQREPSELTNTVTMSASGSTSSNKDFTEYQIKEPVSFAKFHYKLPQLKEDILKVIYVDKNKLAEIKEKSNYANRDTGFSKAIYDYNEKHRENNIANKEINIPFNKGEHFLLTSYFDFANNENNSKIYSFIKAELIFIDSEGNEIFNGYYSEYVPFFTEKEIRELSKGK